MATGCYYLIKRIKLSAHNNLNFGLLMKMDSPPEIVCQSSSLTSSRCRLDSRLSMPESRNLSHFKEQVEYNYTRSVANHIYSFPLQLEYCASLVSSDESSLERIEEYDLNEQNRKYGDLENQFQNKRLENAKTKIDIEHKKQRKKSHIRNQSALIKKKYKDLIELLDRSISPKKGKSARKGKKKQHLHMYTYAEERQERERNFDRLRDRQEEKGRNKSNRLKTEPDESFKSTFRRPVGEFRFGNIKYTDQ